MAAAQARNRTLILAVSAAGHVVVLAVLVWRLGLQAPMAEPPIINVELTPPLRKSIEQAPKPPLPSSERASREVSAAPPVLAAEEGPAPPGPPVVVDRSGEQVRRALRGLVGCEHAGLAGLTDEERERCRDKLAAGAAPRLALRREAEFGASRSDVPYLNRRPKNGCKLMAAGARPIMGKEGAVGGFGCAWDF